MRSKKISYLSTYFLVFLLSISIIFSIEDLEVDLNRDQRDIINIQDKEIDYREKDFKRSIEIFSQLSLLRKNNAVEYFSPISIDGNDAFNEMASQKGWIGNGTVENPLIIDNIGLASGIGVSNTDLHFIIRNLHLQGDGGLGLSISLDNVSNACIYHNSLINTWYGIHLRSSKNNIISDNTLTRATYGIFLESSGSNIISNNTFENSGMMVEGEEIEHYIQTDVYNNIVNNKSLIYWQNKVAITAPAGAGQIFLINSTGIQVTGQILRDTSVGVLTAFSSEVLIHNNSFVENHHGIDVFCSQSVTIRANAVVNNSRFGITFRNSELSTVAHTIIFNNGWGWLPFDVWTGFFERYGLGLYTSHSITIISNTLEFNDQYGVFLKNSTSTNIVRNTIKENDIGVSLWMDEANYIAYNSIYENYIGIYLGLNHPSKMNEIFNNTIINNTDGLYIAHKSAQNVISKNSILSNSNLGIWGTEAFNNIIIRNNIYNNGNYGVELEGSENNSFKYNNFINNNIEGEFQAIDKSGEGNKFTHNHWDDLITPDENEDGIVDISYPTNAVNLDPYPKVSPVVYLLSIPTLIYPNGGETLSGTVAIRWFASIDSLDHQVTYSIQYSANNGTTWDILAANLKKTTYQWNTKLVNNGSLYCVKIHAVSSNGLQEEDISDTFFTINNQILGTTTYSIGFLMFPWAILCLLPMMLIVRFNRVR